MEELMNVIPDIRVDACNIWALRAPVTEFADSRNVITSREVIWVRLQFSDGTQGWGEATLFGGPVEIAGEVIARDLFPLIRGARLREVHRIWDKLYQTTFMHGRRGVVLCGISALDVALWDGLGKALGVPVVDLLGRYADRVMPYASAGFYGRDKGLDELVEEFSRHRQEGFRAFKMKVGRQAKPYGDIWDKDYAVTLEQDVERVMAVRETIGPDALLMVDANAEWDPATAQLFLARIRDADIFFLEEPVSADCGHLAREIRDRTGIRVAGFETEYTRYAYRDLLEGGALDVVQPDACWCGGISEARRIAALASAYGRLCVPHSLSSALSLHANAQLVASLDNGFLVEWDRTGNPFVDDFVPTSHINDGWLTLADKPGIGFAPAPAQFARHIAEEWSL
jgi:L-alanine-DL-glutamate epimerase-like enolase superfamily enzyme